nr:transposase [Anoxybacter fermentans]
MWKKIKNWFGYKLHLIVDADYELPVEFEVTKASVHEVPVAHKLLREVEEKHPEIIKDCEIFLADRGYDDSKLIKKL